MGYPREPPSSINNQKILSHGPKAEGNSTTFSMPKLHFLFLLHLTLFSCLPLLTFSQHLSASQSQTLFRLRRILENPTPLSSWNRYTSFCSLPPTPSLSISCSASGQVTVLSIAGQLHRSALSANFSSDSLFTTLSRLSSLTSLSLVSLGIWGPLPSKIKRISSLTALNLSSNYFNGTVPNLQSMSVLTDLDLSGNYLGPEFPSLGKNIAALTLRNNIFRGEIPTNLASLHTFQKLDLSSNQLSGPIPAFLFSLPSILYLDLSANKFQGALPSDLTCGKDLTFVNISRNILVGTLPSCIRSNSSNLVVLNAWNCLSSTDSRYQHPNSSCMEEPFAAILPNANTKKKSKITLGPILGIVGGIIGGMLIISLLLFLVIKKVKPEKDGVKILHKPTNGKISYQVATRTPADTRHRSLGVVIGTMGLTPYHVFTIEELDEATNGFDRSNLLREGPQGQFFKGRLQDGTMALVRILKLRLKNTSYVLPQFIDVISKLRHRHLISVLGHCITTDGENAIAQNTVCLVLECVRNGTLRSQLTEWRNREMMKWPQRITAVIGVARGVQFLHTVTVPGIAGNDLNIENILMDDTLTAKISNYNLIVSPENYSNKGGVESPFDVGEESNLCGIQNFEDGKKEDIYQLGVILLEIITGKHPGSQSDVDALRVQLKKNMNESRTKLLAVVDPTICNTFAYDSLRTAIDLAINCVSNIPKERPSIDDVLWNLQYCVQVQDGWASSESLSTQL